MDNVEGKVIYDGVGRHMDHNQLPYNDTGTNESHTTSGIFCTTPHPNTEARQGPVSRYSYGMGTVPAGWCLCVATLHGS